MKDPRIGNNIGERLSLIVWRQVIEALLEIDPSVREIARRNSVRNFPDGSVMFETSRDILEFWAALEPHRRSSVMVRQNAIVRALACFPARQYQFLTTWKYFDGLGGEEDFLVTPTPWTDDTFEHEHRPDNLMVQAVLKRRPSAADTNAFQETLQTWQESVRNQGIFGEGPASLLETKRVKGKRIDFRIDASQSGQSTLNWLTICMLNFGAAHVPVCEVRYTHYLPLPKIELTDQMKAAIEQLRRINKDK
jgi:hypothetical protein